MLNIEKVCKQKPGNFHSSPSRAVMGMRETPFGLSELALFKGMIVSQSRAFHKKRISLLLLRSQTIDCSPAFWGAEHLFIGGLSASPISYLQWTASVMLDIRGDNQVWDSAIRYPGGIRRGWWRGLNICHWHLDCHYLVRMDRTYQTQETWSNIGFLTGEPRAPPLGLIYM